MINQDSFRQNRNYVALLGVLCLIAAFALLARFIPRQQQPGHEPVAETGHRVLFISSYTPQYFTYESQERGLKKAFDANGIEYDSYFMDAKKYHTEESLLDFHDFLQKRLVSQQPYEAVVLGDDDALAFALRYQDELFSGLPIVFFGVNDLAAATSAAQNPFVTGFFENENLGRTMELAQKLFPQKKTMVALHDNSAAGVSDGRAFREYLAEHPELSGFELDTSVLSQDELVERLRSLPQDALLFYMTCYADKDGNVYSQLARTSTVVSYADVPIFRNYTGGEGMGILGGIYMDFEAQSEQAGITVARLLSGTAVSELPLVLETPSRSAFDYSLMKKYSLDFSLLPEDTVFYNQPETFLARFGQILPAVCLIIVGLLLLLGTTYVSSRRLGIMNKELSTSHTRLLDSEQQMKYQLEYDDLLDILNRRTITDFITTQIPADAVYSVVIIDVDGFKALNENYGHAVADSILQYIVALFKEMAKEGNWKIARFGGDEFLLVIFDEALSAEHPIVQKILEGIRSPIPLGDESLAITASIGISASDGITAGQQLIINAETAMYEAKSHGRNGVAVYDADMQKKAREELRIKEKLQEAFDNDGFFMVYQPQIDSQTKKVSGYEALVRMKEPGIYPGQFIPVAERNGWIWRIGRITTELVIKQIAAWRDAGFKLRPVSINYSSNQLNDHGYLDFVDSLLRRYDVPANLLEIEITEGVFLEKSALADEIFKRFRDMGIRLLMDDFGTGYSSLGYLTYIPVDVIKLDKSLVDTYLVDGKDSFIRNIIHLMHDLNKEMIIEGVEEEWQFKRLQEFGADTIQGYYFSKPIPADEAIAFKVS